MTTEGPNGSVGQGNKPLGRTRIREVREVDLIYRPVVRGQWVLFCLGKSVILGPNEIKIVQLPYKMEVQNRLRGLDCCNNKNVRVWMKINSTSLLSVVLKK